MSLCLKKHEIRSCVVRTGSVALISTKQYRPPLRKPLLSIQLGGYTCTRSWSSPVWVTLIDTLFYFAFDSYRLVDSSARIDNINTSKSLCNFEPPLTLESVNQIVSWHTLHSGPFLCLSVGICTSGRKVTSAIET